MVDPKDIRNMKNSLTLIRVPYEEPNHLNLIMAATNGRQAGEIEFYDNADSLTLCANALESFPKDSKDKFTWELGSEDPKDSWAFFFRFRVCLIDSSGHAAINFRFGNGSDFPYGALTDFSFLSEPAGINNLGKLFRRFALLKSERLLWNGIDGEIL